MKKMKPTRYTFLCACLALALLTAACEPAALPPEASQDDPAPADASPIPLDDSPAPTEPPAAESPTAQPLPTEQPTDAPLPAPTQAQLTAAGQEAIFTVDYAGEGLDVIEAGLLPDGRRLWVRTMEGGRIDLWNIETGERRIFEPEGGAPQFAVTAQENDILIAVYNSNQSGDIALWRLPGGNKAPMLVSASSDPQWLVTYSELSPDGSVLAVGYSNGEIRLVNTTSGQVTRSIEAHNDWVVRLAFSPDSAYLLSDSLSFDPNTLIFDVRSGALIATLDRENYDPSFVGVFSPDGSMVAISTFYGISIYETQSWSQVSGVDAFVETYAFTPQGHELLAALDGSTVALSILTGEPTNEYEGIEHIHTQPDGRMLGMDIRDDHSGLTILELSPAAQAGAPVEPAKPAVGAAEPALIEPYCSRYGPDPIFIESNQPVTLTWRWEAATAELVQEHLDKAIYDIRIDGQPVIPLDASEIEYIEDGDYYRITWFAELGMLLPGAHRAERRLNWTSKVSDGWNEFGPETDNEMLWDDCDIIVAAYGGPEPDTDPTCQLEQGQEIHANKTANLWVQPDVTRGSIQREVDPAVTLYVLGPPQWGPIHRVSGVGGWWVPVSTDPDGSNPAYLWEMRVQECFEN